MLSAIRGLRLKRERVDAFLCVDDSVPACEYQRDFVTGQNSALLVSELLGAFGTHPLPGDMRLFRSRERMLAELREAAADDPGQRELLGEYEEALANRIEPARLRYFFDRVHSHESINRHFREHGSIPLLRPSQGCEPDVSGLLATRLAGKRIVAIHMRLRRLDAGYGGATSYARDADFLEWFEFLREAGEKHPDVQFVALGRQQEKPLELYSLPNVSSLRDWGLGLGHELTLILRSDLFIGVSSGFAAMAYFSKTPYFMTRMSPGACKAYSIEYGAERFPFAGEKQRLVYEPETKALLLQLLERGLADVPPRPGAPRTLEAVDPRSWEWERSRWLHPGATSYRFRADHDFADRENAYLLWPRIAEAEQALRAGAADSAQAIAGRIAGSFPRTSGLFPDFLRLQLATATALGDAGQAGRSSARLAELSAGGSALAGARQLLWRGLSAAMRLKWLWILAKVLWEHRRWLPRRLARRVRGWLRVPRNPPG